MKPRKSILDKSFPYTPSYQTDVKATIARAKRELEEKKERDRQNDAEAMRKTVTFRKAR